MNWHLPFLFLAVSSGALIHIGGLGMEAKGPGVSRGFLVGGR